MTKPTRIQRKRTKGWTRPDNTVNVARPSKWGNPFAVGCYGPFWRKPIDNLGAVGFFKDMLSDPEMMEATGYPTDLSELRGKNLMCWCKVGDPCHADVLLEIANSEDQ